MSTAVVPVPFVGRHGAGSNPAADARAQKQRACFGSFPVWPARSKYHKGENLGYRGARQLVVEYFSSFKGSFEAHTHGERVHPATVVAR